jgi:hypothetical protein
MFATTTLLSTFYACAIALNTQLVFVLGRVPKDNKQILYLVIPPILALIISRSRNSFTLAQLIPVVDHLSQLLPL